MKTRYRAAPNDQEAMTNTKGHTFEKQTTLQLSPFKPRFDSRWGGEEEEESPESAHKHSEIDRVVLADS